MREESIKWLDTCLKGNKEIEKVIDIILTEYNTSKDIMKEELDKRCEVRFEVYSNPIYSEYHTSLETLVQVLHITGVIDNE